MIIAVGLPRCGGYSLQQALSLITHKTVWHSVEPSKLAVIEGSAGACECWLPIPYLRRRFPDARFILNVRDTDAWEDSVLSIWDQSETWNNPLWRQHPDSIRDYAHDYLATRVHYLGGTDYLTIDITRNPIWEPLAMWLGLPVPDKPFPNADKVKHKLGAATAPRMAIEEEHNPYLSLGYF